MLTGLPLYLIEEGNGLLVLTARTPGTQPCGSC